MRLLNNSILYCFEQKSQLVTVAQIVIRNYNLHEPPTMHTYYL